MIYKVRKLLKEKNIDFSFSGYMEGKVITISNSSITFEQHKGTKNCCEMWNGIAEKPAIITDENDLNIINNLL